MALLVIDADSLVYKAGFVCERKMYDILPHDLPAHVDVTDHNSYAPFIIESFKYVKEYTEWLGKHGKTKDDFIRCERAVFEPVQQGYNIVDAIIEETIARFKPDQTVVYLSGEKNFRTEIARLREYKESRKDKAKPRYYAQLRAYMVEAWSAVVTDGCEADDAVAIQAATAHAEDQDCIIATIDKDLLGVPGWNYNFDTKKLRFIAHEEATRWFYTQLLAGDATDSIPGVEGIGPKKAAALLEGCNTEQEMYTKVADKYDEVYGNKSKHSRSISGGVLTEQARLLWMQRYKGQMWEPPTPPAAEEKANAA